MTKRIISVLLSILMILSSMSLPAFAVTEPAISFGEAVLSGDQVKVPVKLSGLPASLNDLSAFTMKYTYSADKLVYTDTEGVAIGDLTDEHKEAGSVSWYSNNAISDISDTTLFNLVFTKATGATGDVTIGAVETELGSSEIKYYDLAAASTTFTLDAIVPATVTMGSKVDGGVVEVPVTLDKIPDELDGNLSAVTFGYTYDTSVLSYKETKAGVIPVDGESAVAGKVSWYTNAEPVTKVDAPLFTLVFDVIDNQAEEARVAPAIVEFADSEHNYTSDVNAIGVVVDLVPAPVPAEDAVLSLGNAVITDNIVKIPVNLDKVPEDIEDIAALSLHYTFDKEALTYIGVEKGLMDATDYAVEGNVSWYTDRAIAKETVDNSTLFTLVFEVKPSKTGTTAVAIDMVEMSGSAMKASKKLSTKDVTFELPEIIAPEENAKITFVPVVDNESGEIKVAVKLDKLPSDIIDISAATVKYTYDATKITYEGTESGIIETSDAYAAQGVVSWYSNDAVTADELADGVLFTLVFSTNDSVSGTTRVEPYVVELADSAFDVSKLVDSTGCEFAVPEITAPEVNAVVSFLDPAINGREVTVPVKLDKIPSDIADIAAVTMQYTYDTALLTYKGIEAGVVAVDEATSAAGNVSWYSADAVTAEELGDGILFNLKFEFGYEINNVETGFDITVIELGDSNMKASDSVDHVGIRFTVPYIEAPEEESVLALGTPVIDGVKISVPVTLDKLPSDIKDIAAIKVNYSYDNTVLTYNSVKAGVIPVNDDFATSGVVSWYQPDGIVPSADAVLFTLEFTAGYDLAAGTETTISITGAELAESDMKASDMVAYKGITFELPVVEAPEDDSVLAFGEAVIDGRTIRVPVTLDKLPGDIKDLAAVTVKYTFDDAKISYKDIEAGIIPVESENATAGNVSWYQATGIVPADDSVLFTLVFEAKYDVSGDTVIGVSEVELADSDMKASDKVVGVGTKFVVPEIEAPEDAAKLVYGPATVVGGTIKVPVSIDKIPGNIKDIAAVTAGYTYDSAKIAYAGIEAGLIDAADMSVDGKVSWYSQDAVTEAGVLYTLVFKLVPGASGVTELVAGVTEIGDSDAKSGSVEAVGTIITLVAIEEIAADDITVPLENQDDIAKYIEDVLAENGIDVVYDDDNTETVNDGFKVEISADGKTATITYGDKSTVIDITLETPAFENVTVQFENELVDGRMIEIPVTLEKMPGDIKDLAAVKIEYSYDKDKLTYKGIEAGVVPVDSTTATPGYVSWFTGTDAVVPAPGSTLFTLKFEAGYDLSGTTDITVKFIEFADSDMKHSQYVVAEGETVTLPYVPTPGPTEPVLEDITVTPEALEIPLANQGGKDVIAAYVKNNITVMGKYSDNQNRPVAGYTVEISDDEKTAIVTYEGKSDTVALTMEVKKLSGIETDKTKLEIPLGKQSSIADIEAYVKENVKVTAKYENADPEELTDGYTIKVSDDKTKATVTYEGKTADIALTMEVKKLSGIETDKTELEIPLDKQGSIADIEAYVKANVKVTAKYENSADEELTDGYTIKVSDDKTKATVTYEGKTADITLTLEQKILSEITAEPATLNVPLAEQDDIAAFVKANATVTAIYENADPEVIAADDYEVVVSDDNTKATIKYGDKEVEIALTLDTEAKVVTEIIVTPDEITVPYENQGSADDIKAYVESAIESVTAKYEDGSSINVASYEVSVNEDATKATVTYEGVSAEIDLTMEPAPVVVESIRTNTKRVSIDYDLWTDMDEEELAEYIRNLTNFRIYADMSDGTELDITDVAEIVVDMDDEKATITYEGKTAEITLNLKAKPTTGGGSGGKGSYGYKDIVVPIVPGPIGGETTEPEGPFDDISPDHYAYEAIQTLYDRGVISGAGNNKVFPNMGITREETAKIAIAINNIDVVKGLPINFTDADEVSSWATDYVGTAIAESILVGYGDGTVRPRRIVTRGEMVAIIIRSLGVQTNDTTTNFSDVPSDLWSAKYISAASQLGFINGYEDGTFKPEQSITRAEAFMIYYRVLQFRDALTAAAVGK